MSNRSDPRIQIKTVKISGWRAIAAIVVGIAVLVAVAAFLALGFLFIVVPTLAIASVAYYFRPKPTIRSREHPEKVRKIGPTGTVTIIDGEYEVARDDANETGRTGTGQK